jgi:hypothetical protein
LLIDAPSRRRFVEHHRVARRRRRALELLANLGRLRGGRRLHARDFARHARHVPRVLSDGARALRVPLRRELRVARLGVLRERFPHYAIVGFLRVNGRVFPLGIRRRHEGAGIELRAVSERALKPHRELARHLELVKRVAMVTARRVHGVVAGAAKLVKELARCPAKRAAVGEHAKDIHLVVVGRDEEPELRGRALREELAEVPQVNKARCGRRYSRSETRGRRCAS